MSCDHEYQAKLTKVPIKLTKALNAPLFGPFLQVLNTT